MLFGLQDTPITVPSEASGMGLLDTILDHIAQAPATLAPAQIAPLLLSFLADDNKNAHPGLDRMQRQALVAALYERYGDAVSAALEQQIPKLAGRRSPAEVLMDWGSLPLTPKLARDVLTHGGWPSSPSVTDVAHLVCVLLQGSTPSPHPSTNMQVVADVLNQMAPSLDWKAVIKSLDVPNALAVPPSKGLGVALGALIRGASQPAQALSGLWGVWTHRLRQLQLLYALLLLNEDAYSVAPVPVRRILTMADVAEAPSPIQAQAQAACSSSWNSIELIETLMELAGSAPGAEDSNEVGRAVTAILERAIQTHAECVLLGLAMLPSSTNAVHPELVTKLLAMFLAGHPSQQLVFWRLWQTQPQLLLDTFQRIYAEAPLQLSRIVEVAQELQIINKLLEQRPMAFALDAAALAARRDQLQLEPWLQQLIADAPPEAHMIATVLDFLEQKTKEDLVRRDPQAEPTFVPLNVQQVATFLRVLRGFGDAMSAEDIEHFKIVRNLCLQLHPRLMTLTPGSVGVEPGLSVTSFSKDVHREADSWYRQMYEEKVSVDDIISLLRRCKHSDDDHEHQLFACMVHTLFDEHRWFELYYPPRELLMTAVVFGSLIQYQLIDSIPLGIAIRYVVDALRSAPDSTMFHFGVQALMRFQKRLAEWPQLCQLLLSLPTLQQTHPELVLAVNQALAAAKSGQPLPSDDEVFTSVSVGKVPAEGQTTPDEALSDQILFLINNLSPVNVEEKLPSARSMVREELLHWLARYLVNERVSTEPNNHDLYLQFLEGLEQPRVFLFVLHETIAKLKGLLEAEKTTQSSQDRTVLKNLASWLGLTTLAQDRPIKHRYMALKELLLQGHEAGRLIVAIPFVCKVLEHCARSTVFHPPNPWLMGVLRLLVELYQFADLKLNLKFEIEVLCKSLHVDLSQLEPSALLPGRRPDPLPAQPNTEYAQVVAGMDQLAVQDHMTYQDMFVTMLQNMAQYIVISPQIVPYANSAAWKRVMYVALERAIQEIITPVVERSVTIASISTRELVSKDFAMEPDEHKMRTAAHQMAQNMAGSLALVTCKEPLRLSILAHARTLFAAGGVTEQALPEQALLLLVQDNLDLACVVIEKTAMEKALAKVDEGLATAYATRREYQAHGRGAMFWDGAALSHYSTTLPDMLRIAPPGLQPSQLRVYDNLAMTPMAPRTEEELEYEDGSTAASMGGGSLVPARALERFLLMAAELERFFGEVGESQTLATLPRNHFVRQISPHLTELVLQSVQRDETVLLIAQKTVQLLYKAQTHLAREVWVAVLEHLCEQSPKVAKEVTAWLVYAEDERKFHVPVTLALVRANLIGIAEQDQQLAKLLLRSQFRASVVDFSAQLVRECLQEGLATRAQFATLLSALHKASQFGRATPAAQQLLDELDELAPGDAALPLREQLAYSFASWVRVFQQAPNPEKAFIEYVTQLQSQNVLKGEELASLFFRMCTEVSVGHYMKQQAVGGTSATGLFSPIDTFAQLIVYLVKYHADPNGTDDEHAKVHYLTKILSIIVLVLAQSHEELGARFQQRPFFRLFSSVLHDLHSAESSLRGAYQGALLALANALNTLQPLFFPGFSFAWVSLMSHRLLLPQLLQMGASGIVAFHRLLVAQLRFLAPFLRQSAMHDTTRLLYTSTLRVLLLLLHDFPEYLVEHHQSLCDVIPPNCIQMRNLVLCAYPSKLRLPDPFAPSVRLASMPEASLMPTLQYDPRAQLSSIPGTLALLDDLLRRRAAANTGAQLAEVCKVPASTDMHYRESVLSAMVLYVTETALKMKQTVLTGTDTTEDALLDLFHVLLRELEPEGRYLLLSAAANQLRFPSQHTAYLSAVLVSLYAEDDTFVREQIMRVLLERVIVHRPHPWGLLYTFAQLLRLHTVPLPQAPPEIRTILEHMTKALLPDRPVASAAP